MGQSCLNLREEATIFRLDVKFPSQFALQALSKSKLQFRRWKDWSRITSTSHKDDGPLHVGGAMRPGSSKQSRTTCPSRNVPIGNGNCSSLIPSTAYNQPPLRHACEMRALRGTY